jgi:hypothetical protein
MISQKTSVYLRIGDKAELLSLWSEKCFKELECQRTVWRIQMADLTYQADSPIKVLHCPACTRQLQKAEGRNKWLGLRNKTEVASLVYEL